MNFIGSGQVLSGDDFARAAKTIGCDIAAIRAVAQVEARGQGFDTKRRPIVLFEPHVFYRCLPSGRRAEAISRGLAYPDWKPGAYLATQDGRYAQIEAACVINEAAGLMAASWGIGQVLGENWKVCDFASPQALVEKCIESEGGQLDVMVGFIVGNGLGRHLRSMDWTAFAKAYNGPGYAKNQYDVKLARAYSRFITKQPVAYDPLADGLLSIGDKGDVVKVLQIALGVGADGDFGPMTAQAVAAFQREHGLAVDGKVGKRTGKMLGLGYWG